MLPTCDSTFWTYNVTACDPITLRHTITYFWDPAKPCKVDPTIKLPNTITQTCTYIPSNASIATTMSALSYVGIAISVVSGALLFVFRKRPSVK